MNALHTVRDFALEIAYKKFTGDLGLDFLAHLRNQVGARQGSDSKLRAAGAPKMRAAGAPEPGFFTCIHTAVYALHMLLLIHIQIFSQSHYTDS